MKNVKFKTWDKEQRGWLKYVVMLPSGRVGHIADDGSVVCFKDADVDVLLFTGLKDKNGTDIYEGDVVKNPGGFSYQIKFENGSFIPKGIPYWHPQFEIIGNIYENAQLLSV